MTLETTGTLELEAIRKVSFKEGMEAASLEEKIMKVSRGVILKKQGKEQITSKEVDRNKAFLKNSYARYIQLAETYDLPKTKKEPINYMYQNAMEILGKLDSK